MKWNLKPRWMTEPDEEYVVRLRRQIVFWEYWRYTILFLTIGLLILLSIFLLPLVIGFIQKVQPANQPLVILDMFLGFMSGFLLGSAISHVFSQLMLAFTGFRSERLLLKYYDASIKSADEKKDWLEIDSE